LDVNDLQTELKEFPDVNDNLELLTGYVKTYAEWSQVADQLLAKQIQYKGARGTIDQLNLSKDQLDVCLETPKNRADAIDKLKTDFPDRVAEIVKVVEAGSTTRCNCDECSKAPAYWSLEYSRHRTILKWIRT